MREKQYLTIWIKEFPKILSLDTIRRIVKPGVQVKKLSDLSLVRNGDKIMCSKQDDGIKFRFSNYDVLYIEDILRLVEDSLNREFKNCYSKYYLKEAIKRAYNNDINTICAGNSYGLLAINEIEGDCFVNCSLQSQDIYYSYFIIRDICSKNNNIENVVLISPYYYFYSDLSASKNYDELSRISRVYGPLFGDLHNAIMIPRFPNYLMDSDIFDLQRQFDDAVHKAYNRDFFKFVKREQLAFRLWTEKNKSWSQISHEEKDMAARKRTDSHNKSIKHVNTLTENIEIFADMVSYLRKRNIKLHVIVPPATKQYRKYADGKFKDISYEVWNMFRDEISIYDWYDSEEFTDDNFVDTDHLNDSGAEIFTRKMSDILRGE